MIGRLFVLASLLHRCFGDGVQVTCSLADDGRAVTCGDLVYELLEPQPAMAGGGGAAKRELAGINNAMPGPSGGGARGYVILGAHDSWASVPTRITIGGLGEFPVTRETYEFMARGLALTDGALDADVTCEDGTTVACVVNVETVC